ncbi:MAG: alpha-2-macroglobulin family protein [Bacteroidetes bacterium]|nr:alpha-2-macroglobulin family protein [Bacteroidota bacterium]
MIKITKTLSLIALLALTSCARKPGNEVFVETKNFGDQIALQQNLEFTFSHDLVSTDKIGVWDSVPYFKIEPEVAGRFRWSSPNTLSFSPEHSFAPSTDYTLRVQSEILNDTEGESLYLSDELKNDFSFHTPYLKAESIQAYWSRQEGSQDVRMQVQLDFNYKVEVNGLASMLEFFVDDEKTEGQVLSNASDKQIKLLVDPANKGEEDVLLRIRMKKGLRIAGSEKESQEDQELSVVLPSRLRLEVTEVSAVYENGEGTITVYTSQELQNVDLSGIYKLSPSISTNAEKLENGFEIKGSFDISQVYSLTIFKKLEGVFGGKMKDDFQKNLSFGELKPSIGFTNEKAIYLSSAGAQNIGVNIVNVDKIKVKIYKIYQNNILAYLRYNTYENWDYDYELEEYTGTKTIYRPDESGNFSDLLSEQEISTNSLPKINGIRTLKIDIPNQSKDYRGIYFVMVQSSGQRYLRASKLISVSDVGIMTKVMENRVLIMAHSIMDTRPLSGVDVQLVSSNNQLMVEGKTGPDGVLIFDKLNETAPGFKPAMVTVQTAKDFNFVPFSNTAVETSRFDVGGKYENATGFDAYIYGERNLYRPGETIHLNTLVRTNDWKSVGEVPLKWKLLMPNGRELKTEKVKTNKEGAIETSIELPGSALTGGYNFEVYNGNDKYLASYAIQVEEFMPDRIHIKGKLNQEIYTPGDTLRYHAMAENFFGPPAANRKYEFTLQMNRVDYRSKNFPAFRFYNSDNTRYENVLREGKTSDQGMIDENMIIAKSMKGTGLVNIKTFTTVFDESGRPVHSQKNARIFTQDVFYGIRLDDYYVSTNSPMNILFAAVDQQDRFKNGAKASVEIYRYEWQNVIENSNNYYQYRSRKAERIQLTKNITFGSQPYAFQYIPRVSGEYEIRIKDPGAQAYVSYHFYSYGWGYTENNSFEVSTEGQIEMETNQEHYQVGDEVKILMKTPFSGKILLSIERDNVFQYKVIETDKKSAEYRFKVTDEHVPNVYVSATLIRPMNGSNMPLTVAHGYIPVMVEKKSSRLPVEIVAVDKSRSRTKQKITIKSRPESDIEVTLAAVDEGILQLRHFKTPDPHGYYYQKRALEVSSYDIYAMLFPELNNKKSSGGDADREDMGGDKRANPLANKRVKLLSKWSGILHTNSKGEASYELDIPQFNGEIRLMAVCYKGSAFGASSKPMTIADPIVINTSLPRFLSPGDEVRLPVNLANTTDKATQAKIQIMVEGELKLDGPSSLSVSVPAHEETKGDFRLLANESMGQGKITVLVQGLGETFKEELDITIRPAVPLTRHTVSGMYEKGNHQVILNRFDELIPESREVNLIVSKSPLIQFMDKFNYLIGYPHGCVEQTTSKAFPQIYLSSFITKHKNYFREYQESSTNPEYNVQQAIIKLSNMQQYNGAMSYWPGGSYTSYWGTAYATHFLLEAKKAGYEVSQQVINRCLSYLEYRNGEKLSERHWYLDQGTWTNRIIADRAQIYSLYVLSIAGKPNRSLMNHFKANIDFLSVDSRYMLAAAYAMLGDMNTFKNLIPAAYPDEASRSEFSGNFSSDTRNLAISLNTLVEIDQKNSQIPVLARLLSNKLRSRRYYNTQELVFSFLALGKLQKSLGDNNVSALIKSDGRIIGRFDGNEDLKINRKDLQSGKLELEVNGKMVYFFAEVSGINAAGNFEENDNFLQVRRSYFDRFGNPITSNHFKQNDLVVVRVAISSLAASSVENVAITDMLPAGFEIENPRLNDFPNMNWIKNKSTPDYYDFRDDRVNLYTTAQSSTRYYYYIVRAVSPGKYKLGPIGADAMYNGEYHSYHGGGTVVIE